MQALTGLFARQFGTPNYAAHGGFCSVNMAAGMIYTIGGSFWEFGGPDLERAQAVRDDRHRRGPSLEPAQDRDLEVQARAAAASSRSIRCAPATRRSPTSGCRSARAPTARCLLALHARADRERPVRPRVPGALHQRAASSSMLDDGEREGMFAHDPDPAKGPPGDGRASAEQAVVGPRIATIAAAYPEASPTAPIRALDGELRARRRHAASSRRSSCCASASRRARRSGRRRSPASRRRRIRRLAHEMGVTARDQAIELPIAWTDAWGMRARRRHRHIRSRSTRCAASPRTRTAFRRCARWRS